MANGRIPDGLDVLHECDNPPCCNPEHLFLGTHADNMNDCKKKGRMSAPPVRYGESNNKSKLNKQKILEIRNLAGTTTNRAIAKHYGVDPSVIGDIVNGLTWRHI